MGGLESRIRMRFEIRDFKYNFRSQGKHRRANTFQGVEIVGTPPEFQHAIEVPVTRARQIARAFVVRRRRAERRPATGAARNQVTLRVSSAASVEGSVGGAAQGLRLRLKFQTVLKRRVRSSSAHSIARTALSLRHTSLRLDKGARGSLDYRVCEGRPGDDSGAG